MSTVIRFFVPGVPATAGSKRAFPNPKTGRPIIVDSSGANGKLWRQLVRVAAQQAYQGPPLEGPLEVRMEFFRVRPKGHYGTGKHSTTLKATADPYPAGKPDVLKLARAVEDALTGLTWFDDAQIVTEILAKSYGAQPGAQVEITREEA